MEDIQKSLEIISRDLSSIEQELLPQLDGLAQAIPEIYAGYASMVRELVSTTMNLFDVSGILFL